MKTKIGTIEYIAPEVLSGEYGIECDLWSAGCVLYVMLSGMPLFYGDNPKEVL